MSKPIRPHGRNEAGGKTGKFASLSIPVHDGAVTAGSAPAL